MYATRPGYSRSVASFRRFGIEPVILGLGERFTHQEKICIYYRWCVEHPGETVMALDAYDTCCVRAFSEDLSTDGVLFSAEANCWPEQSKAAEYPQSETRYRYLNGGAWLGNTSAFAAVCEQNGLLSGVTNSDQRAYTSAFLGGAAIRLDHGCEVFHSRYAAQDDCEIADGIYWVKSTGTAPLVAHGNGKSDIESVWEAFGV
jgi:hypothetical protein